MMDAIPQFSSAIQAAGLTPPEAIEADGRLHRFASNGRRGDLAGWYVLHGDGIPAGAFGCWRTGLKEEWHADPGRALTDAERTEQRQRMAAVKRERERAECERHAEAAERAAREWEAAEPATAEHPYLARKQVQPHGLRVDADGRLLVPVRNGTGLQSLQRIAPDGEKRFLGGGQMTGGYFAIGGKPADTLCIAEGFATAASIHEATGYPVAVAFNAGNLLPVAKALREKLPASCRLIVCADDDIGTAGNPGLSKAREAALAVGGLLAVPDFGPDRPEGATDFNDLAQCCGLGAVRERIKRAAMVTADAEPWPEPLPLISCGNPKPYPLEALPDLVRHAVTEVQAFTKAPVSLVAGSALAALSVSVQHLADVKRAAGLSGPAGLYLLTIAESGERKTTCDGFFLDPIRTWEAEQKLKAEPLLKEYRGQLAAWEAAHEGLKNRVRHLAKAQKPTREAADTLADHAALKPEPPRVPRLVRVDETPESLAWALAHDWPSAGLISSEAGLVLGSHGMGRDSLMRNLGLLNALWDGKPMPISRRTSESYTVRGARLMVALQIQEPTLRAFFEQSDGLARGTGFLSRFLVAWPESTQGQRMFTDAGEFPRLAVYQARLLRLLDAAHPMEADGTLAPPVLALDAAALARWRDFHDGIEHELRPCGDFAEVRDVAAKAADNAARLACLFHVLEHGPVGTIGAASFQRAARLVAWYLTEARRFYGAVALPVDLANAVKLDDWLIQRCRETGTDTVSTRDIVRHGPNPVRRAESRDAALAVLEEADRIRLAKAGKQKLVKISPALLATVTLATPATLGRQQGATVATVATVSVATPYNTKSDIDPRIIEAAIEAGIPPERLADQLTAGDLDDPGLDLVAWAHALAREVRR